MKSHLRLSERLILAARHRGLAPFLRLADARIAPDARVLDVGCGYGQASRHLAREPEREVVGLDSSLDRIRAAKSLPHPANLRYLRSRATDAFARLEGAWDAYLCVDTLLYLTPDEQAAFLTEARQRASENALLFIKDSTTIPVWKFRYTRFEERLKLAMGYYGRQEGALTLTYRSPEEWERLLTNTGWKVIERKTHGRWLPYPGWVGVCDLADTSVQTRS